MDGGCRQRVTTFLTMCKVGEMGVDTFAEKKKMIVIREMSGNENTPGLGRRAVKQGLCPQLSNWGWVEKSDTRRNLKLARKQLIGT